MSASTTSTQFTTVSLHQTQQAQADADMGVLSTTSTAFVVGVTVLLVGLALFYAASAVKAHVNTSNTVEALFSGVDRAYLKGFAIKRPDVLF